MLRLRHHHRRQTEALADRGTRAPRPGAWPPLGLPALLPARLRGPRPGRVETGAVGPGQVLKSEGVLMTGKCAHCCQSPASPAHRGRASGSTSVLGFCFVFLTTLCSLWGSLFPDQGSNLWKLGVLTTGPPGSSPEVLLLILFFSPFQMGPSG